MKDVKQRLKLASLASGVLLASAWSACAGGFQIQEQSTDAIGLSTAGAAAGGGGLGSMFWNPATMTDYAGWQSSYAFNGILPTATINARAGSALLPLGASSGQMLQGALVPASYSSYQLNDRIWLGLAMNSPFGLVSANPNIWAGNLYGITSKLYTLNINPNLAYELNDKVSLAAGLQVERFEAYQSQAVSLPAPFGPGFGAAILKGYSWGVGFTLGATLKPWDGGEFGIGYRSRIQESINGSIQFTASNPPAQPLPVGVYSAHVDIPQPDMVTLGFRQKVTPKFTLLTGFEWTDWSLLGAVPVTNPGPGPLPPAGLTYSTIRFNYRNGWLASLGGEYAWNDKLTLRAGTAYDKSPVNDATRQVTLPDADRIWLSLGATYKFTPKLTADFAYAHLFVRTGNISYAAPVPFLATTSGTQSNIVSLGLTYRWDDPTKPIKAKF